MLLPLLLPIFALMFFGLGRTLKSDHRMKLPDKIAAWNARVFKLNTAAPAMWQARTHGVLAVELDLLTEHINSRQGVDVECDRWGHQALAAPGKVERSLKAYKFITMEFLLGGAKRRSALRHAQ